MGRKDQEYWKEILRQASLNTEVRCGSWSEEIDRFNRTGDLPNRSVLKEIEVDVARCTQPNVRTMHPTWTEIKGTGKYGTKYNPALDPNRRQNNRWV